MSPLVSNSTNAAPAQVARIIDELLAFLWQQWSQLGVAGDAPLSPDHWLIDPEALLLFTFHLGRFDPRLFDEVLDWCARNGEWLSVQRLKSLSKPFPTVDAEGIAGASQGDHPSAPLLARTIGAVAATLLAQTRSARWRALLPSKGWEAGREGEEPIPFFRERTGEPLPSFGKEDPHFLAAGLSRSPVALRGLSMPPSIDTPSCLILKLRALFGLDPRAEVVAYLLTHPIAGTRELARATVYAPSTVHTVLSRLSAGRFLLGGPGSGYEAERSRWRTFLGGLPSNSVWVDWARVLPTLATALDILAPITAARESPYLRASRWLRVGEHLREALTGSGLPNPFAASPWRINDAEDRLPESLLLLARQLSGEKSAGPQKDKVGSG